MAVLLLLGGSWRWVSGSERFVRFEALGYFE